MPNIATISGNMLTESVVDLATLPSGSGTTNYLPKWATSTSLGNSLVFDNGTNVGIGTTSPANALHIDKGNAIASYLQFTAGTTTGQTATDGFEVGIDASGNGIINQQENLPISLLTNNTQRLLVKADGTSVFSENVRIKVTKKLRFAFYDNDTNTDGMEFYLSNTPQAFIACPFIPALNISVNGGSIATFGSSSLTLRGDLSISGGTGGSIVNTGSFRNYLLQSNGAGTIGRTAASPAYSFYGDGSTGIWSPATGVVGFSISGTEAMRLSSASNLLIGTTTDNGQKLQVSGNTLLSNSVANTESLLISTSNAGTSPHIRIGTWGSIGQIFSSQMTFIGNNCYPTGTNAFTRYNSGSVAGFLTISNNGMYFGNKVNANGNAESSAQMALIDNNLVIGAVTVNTSAALQVESTTKGFLPPRMTAAQAEAIATPAEGLMVYATTGTGVTITSKGWWGYDGAAWVKLN